jgi:Rps23 Pro-64 3,4-dihydroxylase Tpa1-like proline 4-hydroxylase
MATNERTAKRFFDDHNQVTRIDIFDELSGLAEAALRAFFRRMQAPHLLDEVVLPLLKEGDSQVFAAVRDRPWPPWGLGARHISGVCQIHLVGDDSYGLSPVYVADEDLSNVALQAAVYKEALEYLVLSRRAEIQYLVADGSVLADHVMRSTGFERTDDVFLTEHARYFTYRMDAADLLKSLGLTDIETPDLLAYEVDPDTLERNARFHSTVYLASRPEWAGEHLASEIARLVRGGHYSKPGGVPTGTGRFGMLGAETLEAGFDPRGPVLHVALRDFLDENEHQKLLDTLLEREQEFEASTISRPGEDAAVDDRIRRSRTLDKLDGFEDLFAERLKGALEESLKRLGLEGFPVGQFEIQATASGDRDYFRMHQDTDDDDSRELTFVYFLNREPRPYLGGELRLFETSVIDGKPVPTERAETIVPRDNTLVVFPSRHEHEVLPVRVPSKEFGDSRFTVNGWIHRG